ncbi:ATP-binding protein [Microbacterium lacus]|uniref:ATP-binding protein n=1 Tax=Microbacterium lacus TaxID=415217 RepID=UPI00384F466E
MTHTLLVSAVGTTIGIDVSALDEGDAAAVRAAWADATVDADAGEPVTTVIPGSGARASMLMRLSQQVTLAAIEAGRRELWMLHAAGVATDAGDVVVFVGPSGRGKTTASRALGQSFGYLSDETIGIELDGRVRVYRKPLSIIEDRAQPKVERAPSSIGLLPIPDAELRVRAIVLLDRQPEHDGPPVLGEVDLGDALAELVAQTSYLPDLEAPLRFIAAVAAATGGIRSVTYREAVELPGIIPDLVVGDAVAPVMADAAAPEAPNPQPVAPSEGPHFTRVTPRDELALEDPDRVAVLTVDAHKRGTVHVIAGIAPALWRAAGQSNGSTLEALTEAALAAYGEPPADEPTGQEDAAVTAVRLAVGQLLDEGLLTTDEPRYHRHPEVAWVDREDRVVALALEGPLGQPQVLTGSAALIWDWLEHPVTLTQLVSRSMDVAGVEASGAIPEQVRVFIDGLVASRLVTTWDDPEDVQDVHPDETGQE